MAAKEGKRGIGKIVLIVVVALVVIGAIGSMGGKDKTTGAPSSGEVQASEQEPAAQEPAAQEEDPYSIVDEQMDVSNPYALYITGTLTNNTDKQVSYIQVEYNLYDADGAQVGTALANTNNLQAGGVWKFEALGTASPDEVASYELMNVTGF